MPDDPSFRAVYKQPSPLEAAQAARASAEHIADCLRVSELRYRRLFETARDGILILDSAHGKIIDANPFMIDLLGYALDELIGKELWEIGLLRDKQASQEAFGKLEREHFIRYENLPLKNRHGELRQVEFVSNIYRENGHSVIQCNIRDITERKQAEQDRERLVADLQEAGVRQRRFLKEMLSSFTEGRLQLCFTAEDLPLRLPSQLETVELSPPTVRILRRQAEAVAVELNMPKDRVYDLVTAIGESAMNAVRHGGGGSGSVSANREMSMVQVWIQDEGKGIREEDLHRATLEKGWSGANSLGHGFSLMVKAADRTYLLTGAGGTTIVLEQEVVPPEPAWMQRAIGLHGG